MPGVRYISIRMIKKLFIPFITAMGRRIERRRFTQSPIYIGGCGRSGTTLLLSILSAHPEIFACPRELNLFEDAREKDGKLVLPKIYRLYRTFIREHIKRGANRYCEKSPSNIRNIEKIRKLHGNRFRMIHIVRDGRDVILSRHPRNPGLYWVEPERWIADVREGLKYTSDDHVYLVRYEDLVTDYETAITGICSFLDLPVTGELLEWHRHATVRQNRALPKPVSEIYGSSIGKWKDPAVAERVNELESWEEAARLLEKLGYEV